MSAVPKSIRADYEDRIRSGELKRDAAQAGVVDRLEALSEALSERERHTNGFLAKLLNGPGVAPKGIYLWGDVGRGKTMLMDGFFAAAAVGRKRRMHFHAFMQDVHARLHAARKAHSAPDAIVKAAGEIAAEARLLCLDELYISDIADAMIVGRLFDQLIEAGTVVVTTSNVPPSGLYKDGLNRDLFLPFIGLIEEKLEIVELGQGIDYRLGRVKGLETFVSPLGPGADAKIQELWERLTDTSEGRPATLEVLGRRLEVPQAARGAARFTFAQLCEAPLGASDYLALAAAFKVVFVENIPALDASARNPAKRFILLIDTLYDRRARLVASSAMPPPAIYSGNDHRQEFNRTASRLEEMQSASWWGARIAET
ncbi:MAG: cell division protein ZapE [Hyphomicrobiales bacterium]